MRSTILTSQLPVVKWHEQIGDPTLADSILDRLVYNAHRLEIQGESLRKKRGGQEPSAWRTLRPKTGAVEMPPRGKRGKLQRRRSPSFPRA